MSGYKTHRLSQEPDDFDGPWPEENAMTKPTVDEVLVLVKDYACKSFMGPDGGLKEAHDKMMAAIEALASHKTDRWNIDEMSDGSLSVCKGEHAGSDPCEPVLYVPATTHVRLTAAAQDVVKLVEYMLAHGEWYSPEERVERLRAALRGE